MIFFSLNQTNCFFVFIFFGLLLGFIFYFFNLLFIKKFKKIYLKSIILCIFYSFYAIFFVFLKNFFNFGIFSFSILIAFLFGIFISKMFTQFLVEKIFIKCYNMFKNKHKDNYDKEFKN